VVLDPYHRHVVRPVSSVALVAQTPRTRRWLSSFWPPRRFCSPYLGMRSSKCPARPPTLRSRRAFTVLETVVALAISSFLLLALVLWVSSLMRSTTSAVQMSAVNRSVRTISTRLEADVLEITTCIQNGVAPPLVKFTASNLGFYADVVDAAGIPGTDGVPDYVEWRFDGSTLARAVVPGSGSCPDSAPVPPSYLTFQATVETVDQDPLFAFYADTNLLDPEENCLITSVFCRVDSIRVRAMLDDVADAGAAPSRLDLSLDLSHVPVRM
jgi:type II secretory pathway component PulJ